MKKLVVFAVMVLLLLTTVAMAEGMGVQVIGGPAVSTQAVSLDDIRMGAEAEIEGYGILTPESFEYLDLLVRYRQGRNDSTEDLYSGVEADFCFLYMNILNNTMQARDYLAQCQVKVVFDDIYYYDGWAYQRNYDNRVWNSSGIFAVYHNRQNKMCGINPVDNYAINPMYEGHYIFGCELPNAVIESKKPLKMIITIDGNEITYNIRK